MNTQSGIIKSKNRKRAPKIIAVLVAAIFLFNTCLPSLGFARDGNYGSDNLWTSFTVAFALSLASSVLATVNPVGYAAGVIAADLVNLGMFYGAYNEYGAPFKIGGQKLSIFGTTVSKGQMYSMVAGIGASAIAGVAQGAIQGADGVQKAAQAKTDGFQEAIKQGGARGTIAKAVKWLNESRLFGGGTSPYVGNGMQTVSGEVGKGIGLASLNLTRDLGVGAVKLYGSEAIKDKLVDNYKLDETVAGVAGEFGGTLTGVGLTTGIGFFSPMVGLDVGANGGFITAKDKKAIEEGNKIKTSTIGKKKENGKVISAQDVAGYNVDGTVPVNQGDNTIKQVKVRGAVAPSDIEASPDGTFSLRPGARIVQDNGEVVTVANRVEVGVSSVGPQEVRVTDLRVVNNRGTNGQISGVNTVAIDAINLEEGGISRVSAYQKFANVSNPDYVRYQYLLAVSGGGLLSNVHGEPLTNYYSQYEAALGSPVLGVFPAILEGYRNMGFGPFVSAGTKLAVLSSFNNFQGYRTHHGRHKNRLYENAWQMAVADAAGGLTGGLINNFDALNTWYAGTKGNTTGIQNPWASRGNLGFWQYAVVDTLKEATIMGSQIGWAYYAKNNNLQIDNSGIGGLIHLGANVGFGTALDALYRRDPGTGYYGGAVLYDGDRVVIVGASMAPTDRDTETSIDTEDYKVVGYMTHRQTRELIDSMEGDSDNQALIERFRDDFYTDGEGANQLAILENAQGRRIIMPASQIEGDRGAGNLGNLRLAGTANIEAPAVAQYRRLENTATRQVIALPMRELQRNDNGTYSHNGQVYRDLGEIYGSPDLDGRLYANWDSVRRLGTATVEDFNNYVIQAAIDATPLPYNIRATEGGLNGFMNYWPVQDKFTSYAAAGMRGTNPIRHAMSLFAQGLHSQANDRISSSAVESVKVIALPEKFHNYAAFWPAYKLLDQQREMLQGREVQLSADIDLLRGEDAVKFINDLFGDNPASVADVQLSRVGSVLLREAFEQGVIEDPNTSLLIERLRAGGGELDGNARTEFIKAIASIGRGRAEGIIQNMVVERQRVSAELKQTEWVSSFAGYLGVMPILGIGNNLAFASLARAGGRDRLDLNDAIRSGIVEYQVNRNINIGSSQDRLGMFKYQLGEAFNELIEKKKKENIDNEEIERIKAERDNLLTNARQILDGERLLDWGNDAVLAQIPVERQKLIEGIRIGGTVGIHSSYSSSIANVAQPLQEYGNTLLVTMSRLGQTGTGSDIEMPSQAYIAHTPEEIENVKKMRAENPALEEFTYLPGEDAGKLSRIQTLMRAPSAFYGDYRLLSSTRVDRFGRSIETTYYGSQYNPATHSMDYAQLPKTTEYYYGPFGQDFSVTRDYQHIKLPEIWPADRGSEIRTFEQGRVPFGFGEEFASQLQGEADRIIAQIRDVRNQGREVRNVELTMEGGADDVRIRPGGRLWQLGIRSNADLARARAQALERLINEGLNDNSIEVTVNIANVVDPGLGPFNSLAALRAAQDPNKRYATVTGRAELSWDNTLPFSIGPNVTYNYNMYDIGGSNMPYNSPTARFTAYDINSGPALQIARHYAVSPQDVHSFINGMPKTIFIAMLREACLGTANTFNIPGVTPEQLAKLNESVEQYKQDFITQHPDLTPQDREQAFEGWVRSEDFATRINENAAITDLASSVANEEAAITTFLQSKLTRLTGINLSAYQRFEGRNTPYVISAMPIWASSYGISVDNQYREVPRFNRYQTTVGYNPEQINSALRGRIGNAALQERINRASIIADPQTGLAFLREGPLDTNVNALYNYQATLYLPPEYSNTIFSQMNKIELGTEPIMPITEIPTSVKAILQSQNVQSGNVQSGTDTHYRRDTRLLRFLPATY